MEILVNAMLCHEIIEGKVYKLIVCNETINAGKSYIETAVTCSNKKIGCNILDMSIALKNLPKNLKIIELKIYTLLIGTSKFSDLTMIAK